MLSGTGRPLRDVLHDQFAQLVDAANLLRIDSAMARFIRGEEVGEVPEVARPILATPYRRMILSMMAYDPVAEMGGVRVPVLLVHGETDIQVTAADADQLRAANPRAAWLPIPNANHVFKRVLSRDPAGQNPSYHDRALPIVPELAEGIAGWVRSIGGS
jgi:pimeloyl-ACP methyl ester carboxylesterase